MRGPGKTFGLNVQAVMLSPFVVAKMDVFQYTMSTGRKLEANLGTSGLVTGIPIPVRMAVAGKNDGIVDS